MGDHMGLFLIHMRLLFPKKEPSIFFFLRAKKERERERLV